VIWQFKDGSRTPSGVTAEATGAALEEIRARHGKLTNRIIAQDWVSTGEGHPLNAWFTPDSEEAALRWWEHEAGNIVRAVVVRDVVEGHTAPVRAYVLTHEDDGSQRYDLVTTVVADPTRRERLLADIEREVDAVNKKHKEVIALLRLLG
jgi:hypothetical protein